MEQPQQPSYTYLFKVLDHCGCLICASYINKDLNNLQYYHACNRCRDTIQYSHYTNILQMCLYELERYPVKELMNHRGWINKYDAARLVLNPKMPANRENGKLLTERMERETPLVEKIEYSADVTDAANPS